jgi:LPXTG-site transpeptidase (sortase) family protein
MKLDSTFWQQVRHSGFRRERAREFLGEQLERTRVFLSKRSLRQAVSPVLVIVGALLLGYVGAQYGEMYLEQRHLAWEWQRQQQASPLSRPAASASRTEDDGLSRLSVPKIDLDSVIVEGTNHKALLLGPGHLKDTPAPGETGNSVITGHRDTFFRHIHELEKGDTVLVQREGKTFRYQVVGKKVVEPDDLSVMRPVKDSQLTLITCYPTYYIGPAPKRLVVFSKLIGEDGENAQAGTEAAH